MALPAIVRLSNRQQATLAQRDQALLTELARQYRSVQATLMKDLTALTEKIEAARLGGERVGPSWLFQQSRLKQLQAQVEGELTRYGVNASTLITEGQRDAIRLAVGHSHALMKAGLGDMPMPSASGIPSISTANAFATLPTKAVERMVGTTISDHAPLSKTLSKYPKEAAQSIRRTLVTSVALGRNPKVTARLLERELGGARSNYLRLARTEQLSAYRAASLDTYKANERVVEGWEWMLGKYDACAFCRSKTGKVYSLDTPFDSHPQCRCSALPRTKSWQEVLAG